MARRPPIELTIEGEALAALQRKLATMDKALTREMDKALRDIASEVIPDARAAALEDLPHRGGLAAQVAARPMRAMVSRSKRAPGVKIVVKGTDARTTNQGRLRHPVFGNREVWVTQTIKALWFTGRMRREAPRIRKRLLEAMEETARKIASA